MNLWTNPLVARQLRLNRETLDFWRLYRSHREAVADLISRTPQPGSASLCILGAGNCNDLDLARFTGGFAQVHLVDLDRQAMAKGVERQSPPAPGRISLHGGIDLTGILKTLATWERHRPKRESIAHCIREARAFAGLPVPDRFEVVTSMCLLIPDHRFGRLDDRTRGRAPGAGAGSAAAPSAPAGGTAFAGRGRSFWFTDFALERGGARQPQTASPPPGSAPASPGGDFLGTSPEELCALASNDPILRTQLCQARVSPSWLWRQNPRRTLRVCAIQFQRIEETGDDCCRRLRGWGNLADPFHGLTPTATCCRRLRG